MLGILGSGFGLYGYLPAAVHAGYSKILLPIQYQDKISSRGDLKGYGSFIDWVESDLQVICRAETIVVARRPSDQSALIPCLTSQENIKTIILEKPLSPTPACTFDLLNMIESSQKKYAAAFIFRYLSWAKKLKAKLAETENASRQTWHLTWAFLAHDQSTTIHTWKSDHKQGGGVVRFFGIHIIALLSELGFKQVTFSNIDNTDRQHKNTLWRAGFKGAGLPEFIVEVDIASESKHFSITKCVDQWPIYHDQGVFPTDPIIHDGQGIDERCFFLKEFLLDFLGPTRLKPLCLKTVTQLWADTEDITSFIE